MEKCVSKPQAFPFEGVPVPPAHAFLPPVKFIPPVAMNA